MHRVQGKVLSIRPDRWPALRPSTQKMICSLPCRVDPESGLGSRLGLVVCSVPNILNNKSTIIERLCKSHLNAKIR